MKQSLDKGYKIGKMYVAAKIYKELTEGATMNNLKKLCQNIIHNRETTNK